ncbi:hypothetical protein GQ457_09G015520 [Hibiscus cannabinus]
MPPGSELNNWIAEELPVTFKTNTKCSDFNGVSNIIPGSQVDFEQNPRIQGSSVEGAINTKQCMIASEKATPTSIQKYVSTTAYLFRLMENRTSLDLAPTGSNGQITISRISTLGFEGSGALVEGTN